MPARACTTKTSRPRSTALGVSIRCSRCGCRTYSLGDYTFAVGLFALGLGAWQVFLALVVGIILVYFLMNFSGYAGQKTGVPYPVLARISFGPFGANLPALIRALGAIA